MPADCRALARCLSYGHSKKTPNGPRTLRQGCEAMLTGLERLTAGRRYIVRNVDGGALLERFFVSGVLAFLLLRFYLELTGFPKIGGNGLHIAHMLWGGLLMLSAAVMLLAFLGRSAATTAAVIGGIGFGIFIDELGKFITSDNNYFYQPAIALIYAIFVLLFLALRAIERHQPRSHTGYLVNALTLTGEAALRGLDQDNTERALALLSQIPAGNPIADALRSVLVQATVTPIHRPGRLARIERRGRTLYRELTQARWFTHVLIAGFFVYAVATAVTLVAVAASSDLSVRRGALSLRGDIFFSSLADLMILTGAVCWSRSHLAGLGWFKRSILVTILLAQPFLFYREQLAALIWLAIDILILETLNYVIGQERLMAEARPHAGAGVAAVDGAVQAGPRAINSGG
jgi:hypothetical protein